MTAVSDTKKNKPIQQDEIDKLQDSRKDLLKFTKEEKYAIEKVEEPQKNSMRHGKLSYSSPKNARPYL